VEDDIPLIGHFQADDHLPVIHLQQAVAGVLEKVEDDLFDLERVDQNHEGSLGYSVRTWMPSSSRARARKSSRPRTSRTRSTGFRSGPDLRARFLTCPRIRMGPVDLRRDLPEILPDVGEVRSLLVRKKAPVLGEHLGTCQRLTHLMGHGRGQLANGGETVGMDQLFLVTAQLLLVETALDQKNNRSRTAFTMVGSRRRQFHRGSRRDRRHGWR